MYTKFVKRGLDFFFSENFIQSSYQCWNGIIFSCNTPSCNYSDDSCPFFKGPRARFVPIFTPCLIFLCLSKQRGGVEEEKIPGSFHRVLLHPGMLDFLSFPLLSLSPLLFSLSPPLLSLSPLLFSLSPLFVSSFVISQQFTNLV
jgi:hypothetical protein